MDKLTYYQLNNQISIPQIGLGTAHPLHGLELSFSTNKFVEKIQRVFYNRIYARYLGVRFSFMLSKAIKMGYRLIDTSAAYGNEKYIKLGIKLSGVHRDDLFITTRVSNTQQYKGEVRYALEVSLRRLGIKYVDLYMFHWPVPEHYIQTWKTMEELYKEGKTRSIGVANCHKHHLEKLFSETSIIPAINQFEVHPLMSQKSLIEYCQSKGITVESYTPIGRNHELLKTNANLIKIAKKYNKTIQQIILRWHIQLGLIPVPRSTNIKRLKQNFEVFDFQLTADEIVSIDQINQNLRLRFDPDNCNFRRL